MNFDFSNREYPKDCRHFNSWGEFVDWCESHQEPSNSGVCAKVHASLTQPSSNRWDGNLRLDGAFKMARDGWPEGMAEAEKISAPLVETIVGQLERSDVVYDNEGIAVDIGRFLAEDPECWIRFETEIVSSPCASPRLITILHNCTESSRVDAHDIISKGAAEAVHSDPKTGYAVSLWIKDANSVVLVKPVDAAGGYGVIMPVNPGKAR